jgi:glycosyltransferase involved in cell wall biosynthesis
MKICAFFPIYSSGEAISHICLSLCEAMQSNSTEVRLLTPASDPAGRRPFSRDAIPRFAKSVAYRLDRTTTHILDYSARRFLGMIRPDELVYLWPGTPLWLYREVKARGHLLVMERINCHRKTARRILDEAYLRLGVAPSHGITDAAIDEECEKLSMANLVFSPAPNVRRSLLQADVEPSKILSTSYGWSPQRLRSGQRASSGGDKLNVLFVGRICVRKGAHLLLEAWAGAAISGTLFLVGHLDEEIASACAGLLSRDDVVHLPYTHDIGRVYRMADVFAFPTLEEGSPLVVYEALGSGLPILTTEMGGGDVVRDNVEGLILEAYDVDAWAGRLAWCAENRDSLQHMQKAAEERAGVYHWSAVGARREQLLRSATKPT